MADPLPPLAPATPCRTWSGVFFVRRCARAAVALCRRCGAPACEEHLRPAPEPAALPAGHASSYLCLACLRPASSHDRRPRRPGVEDAPAGGSGGGDASGAPAGGGPWTGHGGASGGGGATGSWAAAPAVAAVAAASAAPPAGPADAPFTPADYAAFAAMSEAEDEGDASYDS